MKDWQVALEMFGKNDKQTCRLVKKIRTKGITEEFCNDWYLASLETDIVPWLMHKNWLIKKEE